MSTLPITPIPYGQLISVSMVSVAESINAFMVDEMGHGGSQIGYYAGGLAASFCAAQFCSSVMWGRISDKYGRKPAVISGTLGAAIGILIFGTAKQYPQAVVGRLVTGFLSGNIGILKSFLTEITDESNRTKGFAYFSLASATGNVIAPIIGGFLCKPADKYPNYFAKQGVFGVYPYLLPCLVCIFVNVAASFACYFTMVESRKWTKTSDQSGRLNVELTSADKKFSNKYVALSTADAEAGESIEVAPDGACESDELGRKGGHAVENSKGSREMQHLVAQDSTTSDASTDLESDVGSQLAREEGRAEALDDYCWCCRREAEKRPDEDLIFYQWRVWLATVSYGVLAMGYILWDETIPLILKLDVEEGGFSFNSVDIGLLMAITGACVMLFTLFALPVLGRRSKYWLYIVGATGSIPMALCWPVLAIANRTVFAARYRSMQSALLWGSLCAINIVKNLFSVLAYTAVILQINHSVIDDHLGAVNGLGQSLASLARAVGPAVGGMLWSLSIDNNFIFLNFIAVGCVFVVCLICNQFLSTSLDSKKKGTVI